MDQGKQVRESYSALSINQVDAQPDSRDADRLDWLADELLYCDFGDNEHPGYEIGYGVMLSKQDGKQFMFGESVRAAIDAAIAARPSKQSPTDDQGDGNGY